MRLLEHGPARCGQLHDTSPTVVRVDRASDLTTLRGFGDESTGPRLIDTDGLSEGADPHTIGSLRAGECVQHAESGSLRDRLFARVTRPASRTPGRHATGRAPWTAEARAAAPPSTGFAAFFSTVIVVAPALSVLAMMMTLGAPSTSPAAEVAPGLITTYLHERLLDELDGVGS